MWKTCLVLAAISTTSHTHRPARAVALQQVVNHTLCPLVTGWDEDVTRRPPRIRVLRCAGGGAGCTHRGGDAPCCGGGGLQCVELHDTVRVRYGTRRRLYDVAVGCACMLAGAQPATKIPQAPLDAVDTAD